MKRKIIKTLLRYRKLISDHKKEHEVFKATEYFDRDSILAKTIKKDQEELDFLDSLIQDYKNNERSILQSFKDWFFYWTGW